LVDCRKKERSLDLKVNEQALVISDLKKQMQRTNEISRSMIERVKEKDCLL